MQYHNPSLQLSQEDLILTILLDRPKALNALNHEIIQGLHEVIDRAAEDDEVRGIIITGSGEKAFAAGADIKEFSFEKGGIRELSKFGHDLFLRIERYPKPIIAAINGFALGGGCELAMSCHLRIAGKHAKFGQPEINLGIIPGYGGTQRLPQLVGKAKALELLLSGDMIDAAEALRIGLVNQIVPEGEEVASAKKMLSKILTKAPLAAARIIELVNQHYIDYQQGLKHEIEAFAKSFETEDAREGVDAFLNKRKPVFQGR